MKVIIAYDGSAYADAAIDDVARAGFPRDTDILVATVADFAARSPAIAEFDLLSAASRRVDTVIAQMRHHEAEVLREARSMTSKVVGRLRRQFPDWKVHSEVLRGKPAEELLRKVDEWNADLIMGGSQGRSAIGRFFLGSVSKEAAEKAPSSVRVVRGRYEAADDRPIELILGAKNPGEAETIIDAVGKREWPSCTRIGLIAVDDGVSAGRVSAVYPDGKSIYQAIADRISADGLQVTVRIESGDPGTILLEAADAVRADAIFVVAGSDIGEPGLDATASSLVTTAKCSVEIVR